MRAAAPACSLARALRALAGDLSWERLGRIALLKNASEFLPKSLPEASGAHFGPPGAHFGPPGAHFGPPLPGRSGASGEPLGASKTLPNRSRRLSRRPPAPELDFRSILGAMLAPFWDPPDLKKQGFRVESVAFFEKEIEGVRKNTQKQKPD